MAGGAAHLTRWLPVELCVRENAWGGFARYARHRPGTKACAPDRGAGDPAWSATNNPSATAALQESGDWRTGL